MRNELVFFFSAILISDFFTWVPFRFVLVTNIASGDRTWKWKIAPKTRNIEANSIMKYRPNRVKCIWAFYFQYSFVWWMYMYVGFHQISALVRIENLKKVFYVCPIRYNPVWNIILWFLCWTKIHNIHVICICK